MQNSRNNYDLHLVMERVSNSRVRGRQGFRQSGLGSGLVFVFFQSRVRVLPCRVSGFCRVSNLCKKEAYFLEKIQNYFLAFENFSTFFSNLKKNSLKNGLKIDLFMHWKNFLGYFGPKW